MSFHISLEGATAVWVLGWLVPLAEGMAAAACGWVLSIPAVFALVVSVSFLPLLPPALFFG